MYQAIRQALRVVMHRGADAHLSDDEFNRLALDVFAHQFEHNQPYCKFCQRRNVTPSAVQQWTDIPAVPTAAFKEVDLVAGARPIAQLEFKTSGTTRGAERRGVHLITDATLYQDSLLPTFRAFVMPDFSKMLMHSLIPDADEAPDSSLSYMITVVMRELGSSGSRFFAHNPHGIDPTALLEALHTAEQPVCLLGTSLAFTHLLQAMRGETLTLPAGSRLMDTGGFKGHEREVSAEELRGRYREQLGIQERFCINEYGMTEMCSQYYDDVLLDKAPTNNGVKRGPAWLRARVVDPETLEPLADGDTGILQHFDLANLNSVSAILTEDLACVEGNGFKLLGRVPGAMPRGCSIAMDLLLRNAARP